MAREPPTNTDLASCFCFRVNTAELVQVPTRWVQLYLVIQTKRVVFIAYVCEER